MKSQEQKLAEWCVRHFQRRAQSIEAHSLMHQVAGLGMSSDEALAKLLQSSWSTVISEAPARLKRSAAVVATLSKDRQVHQAALEAAADELFPGHRFLAPEESIVKGAVAILDGS